MRKIAFYDAKPYDRVWFDAHAPEYGFEMKYLENRLTADTAVLSAGCDAAVAFVNDTVDAAALQGLFDGGIRMLAMRCAGYNNIDFKAAYGKIHIARVPAYSPYAVAEHAMALLLTLNRKTHRAYIRTRDFNFSLNGLTGFDLHGKTVGVVGTGKIGRVFIDICRGFGMNVIAYDPYPAQDASIGYVSLEELWAQADVISLHCPLTRDTRHMVNAASLAQMKNGVVLLNTSRGALIDSEALLEAIKTKKVGGAALDVYEEESEVFFEDFSNTIIADDVLSRLISMPNVIVTSHQAFLTNEALENIALTTLENLRQYFDGDEMKNEICYQCQKKGTCDRSVTKRCF
ncbi:MAG: 2-hydroxyacid dehydrogenase [Eubacteriales bacterium]|nr:2-hydroxyacid dehydrogenase [Eubacteriales bacterium]